MAKLPTDLPRWRGQGHMILRRTNPAAWVVVPDHRQVKPGTLRGIIADAGFTVEEFVKLLK